MPGSASYSAQIAMARPLPNSACTAVSSPWAPIVAGTPFASQSAATCWAAWCSSKATSGLACRSCESSSIVGVSSATCSPSAAIRSASAPANSEVIGVAVRTRMAVSLFTSSR